ncbi:MAG: ABC transporter substrate-binding protein [Desulfobacterales bacterium]|nr:ABC transporter substrate-binding protein [Desulfobacterales bacterium]
MAKNFFPIIFLVFITFLFEPYTNYADEGVTDTEIHIGMAGPQTGPAAPWGILNHAASFYFDMINNEGGVHGRKIVYHDFNDCYNPARTKEGVKFYQEKIGIFAWVGIIGSETALAVVDYLEKKKVPWVGPVSGSSIWINPPHKYIFTAYPCYSYEASAFCKYAVKNLGKKRIAIIYLDDHYGKTGLEGANKEMAKMDTKLVATVPVERDATSMKNYAIKLIEANADTVLLFLTPFQGLNLIQYAKKMNYFPQWMAVSSFSDFDYLNTISGGELIKNMISTACSEMYENQKLLQYKTAYKKITGKDNWGGLYFHYGIALAEIMTEGLNRTGKNLTRENFVKGMEGIQNFKLALGSYISYKPFNPNDPKCREGQNEICLIQSVEGGKTKVLTEWIKPGEEIILRK